MELNKYLPEIKVLARMPLQWRGNIEMKKQEGESENNYIERMTRLSQRRNQAIKNVNQALHLAAKQIFDVAKQPAYFVPVVGNAVLAGDVAGQVLNKDYTGAATTFGTVGALKYGTPLVVKGGLKVVNRIALNRSINNIQLPQKIDWNSKNISANGPKQSNNGSMLLLQRPSKISEAERAGIPRGERNNVSSIYQKNLFIIDRPFEGRPLVLQLDVDKNFNQGVAKLNGERWTKIKLSPTDNEFTTQLREYSQLLPEALPEFANNDDFARMFLEYYANQGKKVNLNKEEIQKIISENYRQLNQGSKGKLKGRVLWNSTPDRFIRNENGEYSMVRKGSPEEFIPLKDYSKSYKTAFGDHDGIYFGTQPYLQYSYPSYKVSKNGVINGSLQRMDSFEGNFDSQPYMINDVTTVYTDHLPGTKQKINSNEALYTDLFKGNKPIGYLNGYTDEIAVGFGTPIKSLFAHPKAFIKENGKTILKRNWNDPRVHFGIAGALYQTNKGEL